MTEPLVLAVPSKGSLHDDTMRLFERCLIAIRRSRGTRSYEGTLASFGDRVRVVLARADDVPQLLRSGQAHIGVTGLDLVRESIDLRAGELRLVIEDLGFGRADLVVAVPGAWLDVTSMADLVDVAHDVRIRHRRSLRVATKFPRLTRAFFTEHRLTEYRIVESLGATEGAPRAGQADLVVDLTSTGTTLETNGLKRVEGGVVLRSQACLVAASVRRRWTPEQLDTFRQVTALIQSAQAARRHRIIRAAFGDVDDAQRRTVESLLLDPVWGDAPRGVSLDGFADIADVPGAVFGLRSAGAISVRVVEADLLADVTADAADRFIAAMEHDAR